MNINILLQCSPSDVMLVVRSPPSSGNRGTGSNTEHFFWASMLNVNIKYLREVSSITTDACTMEVVPIMSSCLDHLVPPGRQYPVVIFRVPVAAVDWSIVNRNLFHRMITMASVPYLRVIIILSMLIMHQKCAYSHIVNRCNVIYLPLLHRLLGYHALYVTDETKMEVHGYTRSVNSLKFLAGLLVAML